MKRAILSILCIWLSVFCISFTNAQQTLAEDVTEFIAQIKAESIKKGAYAVFVIRVKETRENEVIRCVVSYINNDFEIEGLIGKPYFYKMNDEYLIFIFDEEYKFDEQRRNSLINAHFSGISSASKSSIINKLYSQNVGFITYTQKGFIHDYIMKKNRSMVIQDMNEFGDEWQIMLD